MSEIVVERTGAETYRAAASAPVEEIQVVLVSPRLPYQSVLPADNFSNYSEFVNHFEFFSYPEVVLAGTRFPYL